MTRIAVGGFLHETNTFAPSRADYDAFLAGGGYPTLVEGAAMVEAVQGVNVAAAGMIAEAEARGWTLVPTLWTTASPSAQVTEDAFERIAGRLVAMIAEAGTLDGVLLDLHGAMVADHADDGEGEVLRRVREAVGEAVPVVASLDLHGNVTEAMVDAADALIAYRTYPHIDMAETGRRAAVHLARLLDGTREASAFRQLPFLIPIAWQGTGSEPCRSLYRDLAAMETGPVASLSFLPGFPAADFADCGPSVVAYAGTREAAEEAAERFAALVSEAETAFAGRALAPLDAVREGARIAADAGRPVVIADTQDNPGAGGDSDTTGMLRALVEAGAERAALGVMVDPDAARAAHEAGVGAAIEIALGGKSGIPGDAPLEARFTVEAVSDGRLTTTGAFYGRARMDLGPSACLSVGGVRVVVGSRKAQMADREMFRFLGVEPEAMAVLVVKSSVHFRADFEPIAAAVLVATAPGPMPLDPAVLPFERLRLGVRLSPGGRPFEPPREKAANP
ncbi:MAG: M81 family metallopeptidase [Paracoccaceae bacterium]